MPTPECPICLAELSDQESTPCNHTFCSKCIRAAFRTSVEAPAGFGFCPVCRAFIASSSLSDSHGSGGLFGSTFVEYGGGLWAEGMDSYHFTDAATCSAHISYTSYDRNERPNLTSPDGTFSRPPDTRAFVETSFDERERCFRGTIDWSPRFWKFSTGDGLLEEQRWEFEMYFALGFGTIARGEVRDFDCSGQLVATHRFGSEEGWQYANLSLPEVREKGTAHSGAVTAQLGEENTAALRDWIGESNPTLGEVLQRMQALRLARDQESSEGESEWVATGVMQ